MPLYEYECSKCGQRTEAIQRTSDPLLTVCPNCGGKLRKLLSAPAFQFKGSGFYLTDYGKAGAKPGEAGEKNGEKTAEKSGEKEKDKEKGKEKEISSKGEEGKGTGSAAPSGGEAGGSEAGESKREDSSKGKKDGAPGAAPPSPAGESDPAPSKKKNTPRK